MTKNIETSLAKDTIEFINISNNINTEILIPRKKLDFVPFGCYSALKTIIQSEMFFPVYITGPSGVGKNIVIEQVCASLKRPMLSYSITEETSEEDLIGCWTLFNGNTIWKEGPIVTAARHGMVIVLDEIDLSTPKIMCLQSILNGDPIFIHNKNERVIPKKGFTIIATGNTKGFGESDIYIGTQALNEAFLERFKIMLEQLFPTETVLSKIINKKLNILKLETNEDTEFGKLLAKFITHISSAYTSGATQYYISNRRLAFILETYSIFKNKIKALSLTFGRYPKDIAESFLSLYAKMDSGLELNIEEILELFNDKQSGFIIDETD